LSKTTFEVNSTNRSLSCNQQAWTKTILNQTTLKTRYLNYSTN